VVLLVNDTRGSRVQVVGSRRTLLLVVVMMRLNLQVYRALGPRGSVVSERRLRGRDTGQLSPLVSF
jgi:hypothetical protein